MVFCTLSARRLFFRPSPAPNCGGGAGESPAGEHVPVRLLAAQRDQGPRVVRPTRSTHGRHALASLETGPAPRSDALHLEAGATLSRAVVLPRAVRWALTVAQPLPSAPFQSEDEIGDPQNPHHSARLPCEVRDGARVLRGRPAERREGDHVQVRARLDLCGALPKSVPLPRQNGGMSVVSNTLVGPHTSWGGGHLRHPDFPKTFGKSSKSTIFHEFSMKIYPFH